LSVHFNQQEEKVLRSWMVFDSARVALVGLVSVLILVGGFASPRAVAQALPLEPLVTQTPIARNGQAVDLLSMSPPFRTYLEDALNDKPNFFTTKDKLSAGTEVWVAYEVTGVTLNDSMAGGVDLKVALWGPNQSKAAPETLRFGVMDMNPNPVILGQAISLRKQLESTENSYLLDAVRELYGAPAVQTFLDRLSAEGAHKRMLIVRRYTPEPDQPLGFEIDLGKAEQFVPLSIKVLAGTRGSDLDLMFDKNPRGEYMHVAPPPVPWYQKYRSFLILAVCLVVFVAARAVMARRS
jgi:hypothetical protein